MTEQEPRGDGWTEYRLLVTAMLERHEEAIETIKDNTNNCRDSCRALISQCEGDMRDLVDAKFIQLGQMHRTLVGDAKRDLVEEIKKEREEATKIQVAKITSRWEFWGIVIVQISALAIALIALLKP